MRSGRLDRRVTFRRKTTTKNAFQEDVPTWSDLGTVWAMKLPIEAARETVDANEIRAASLTVRIRIRQGGIIPTALDRFTLDTLEYEVIGVLSLVRRQRAYEIIGKGRADG